MRRVHALELEDQSWFPRVIREAGMAYLRFAGEKTGQWQRVRAVVESALERSGEAGVLDLCSGGAGPVLALARGWAGEGREIAVTLSDRYPDPGAQALAADADLPGVRYDPEPVDALAVGSDRRGLRTLFNAFHHFRPAQAEQILAAAVRDRSPIAVVEVLQRSPVAMIGMLFAPLAVLLLVPFLRPFRPIWIPFTYLVPIIPLFVVWDGIVSCLRVYTGEELLAMTRAADPDGSFDWRVEDIPMNPQPVPGIALVGIPRERLTETG